MADALCGLSGDQEAAGRTGAAVKYDENQDERRDSLPIYSGNQRLVCLRRPLLQVRATAGRHGEKWDEEEEEEPEEAEREEQY